jgi:hypothetical protein
MKSALLFVLLSLQPILFAQNQIPPGTILPLRLNSSLHSNKTKPGQQITARLMQDVPLASGSKIPAGAKVLGHVIDVIPPDSAGAKISLRFDSLLVKNTRIPITANLRAIASVMEVQEAQVPKFGADRGTSENSWNTVQIGGDESAYHGGGPVIHGLNVIGRSTPTGVLVRPQSKPGSECRGEIDGNHQLQALWLFSSDACGAYGFPDLTIVHTGRTTPIGEIILNSSHGDLRISSGSGLLLRLQRLD